MSTRDQIISLADNYIRDKGYNAFSFKDISEVLGIKTASIHYHFNTKTDLGVAVVKDHRQRVECMKEEVKNKTPLVKLKRFLSIYSDTRAENKVCLVGALATDFHTVDQKVQQELMEFTELVLAWVIEILEEGKQKKEFAFDLPARTKALMIITNMMAIVQLSRLSGQNNFELVKKAILEDLKLKK